MTVNKPSRTSGSPGELRYDLDGYPCNILVCERDISEDFFERVMQDGAVALDIETTGLDWKVDTLATCQLFSPTAGVAIVRQVNEVPPALITQILREPVVRKIFHFAFFDLSFMRENWGCSSVNVACTKIAAKMLKRDEHTGLAALLEAYLDVTIDKEQRLSNWLAPSLNSKQLEYAANDVIYLVKLLTLLEEDLQNNDLLELTKLVFRHIPVHVELEARGYTNIYDY